MGVYMYGPNGEADVFESEDEAPEHYRDTPAKARAHSLGVNVHEAMSNEDIIAACELAEAQAPLELTEEVEPATDAE